MRYAYHFIAVLLLSNVTVSPFSLHAGGTDLDIEISLSKHVYVLHERIVLDATITNTCSDTARTQLLTSPNHRQFRIDLRNGKGDLLEYTGMRFDFVGGPGRLLLEAGGQEFGSFDLAELFSPYDNRSGHSVSNLVFPYIPTGSYTVRAYFEEAVSEELSFEIVEPSGDEGMILGLIEEACKAWDRENRFPAIQRYEEIVDRHPKSVFAERCYYFSKAYSQEASDQKKHGTYDEISFTTDMLLKYPNSSDSRGWLVLVTDHLEEEDKMDFLNSLIQDKRDTRASKFATQMRNKLLLRQKLEKGEQ